MRHAPSTAELRSAARVIEQFNQGREPVSAELLRHAADEQQSSDTAMFEAFHADFVAAAEEYSAEFRALLPEDYSAVDAELDRHRAYLAAATLGHAMLRRGWTK